MERSIGAVCLAISISSLVVDLAKNANGDFNNISSDLTIVKQKLRRLQAELDVQDRSCEADCGAAAGNDVARIEAESHEEMMNRVFELRRSLGRYLRDLDLDKGYLVQQGPEYTSQTQMHYFATIEDDASMGIRRLSSPKWIVAEQDYPDEEIGPGIFGDSEPTILVFDPKTKMLRTALLAEYSNKGAIISRLPSRIPHKLYVYMEGFSSAGPAESYRVRITTKKQHIKELRLRHVINVKHLPLLVKMQIITGRIHWLFILPPSGHSRSPTENSVGTDVSTWGPPVNTLVEQKP